MAPIDAGARILLGLLPVFSFLVVLILLDSYKLVRPRWVVYLIATGSIAAFASLVLNGFILDHTEIDRGLCWCDSSPPRSRSCSRVR